MGSELSDRGAAALANRDIPAATARRAAVFVLCRLGRTAGLEVLEILGLLEQVGLEQPVYPRRKGGRI